MPHHHMNEENMMQRRNERTILDWTIDRFSDWWWWSQLARHVHTEKFMGQLLFFVPTYYYHDRQVETEELNFHKY